MSASMVKPDCWMALTCWMKASVAAGAGEGRVERPGSGQGDDELEVCERQLDRSCERDDAVDETEVRERELAVRQAEQDARIGSRDPQCSLDGSEVMAQGGVRDRPFRYRFFERGHAAARIRARARRFCSRLRSR